MKLTRQVYTTRREKVADFLIGFIGMLVIDAAILFAIWVTTLYESQWSSGIIGIFISLCRCVPLFVNIALPILFAITRKWIAFGMLFVVAFLLLVGLCIALFFVGVCFTYLLDPNLFYQK